MIVTYNLEMKRFYTLAALTSIMKKFLKDHNNQLGLFYVSPESIKFAGRFSERLSNEIREKVVYLTQKRMHVFPVHCHIYIRK